MPLSGCWMCQQSNCSAAQASNGPGRGRLLHTPWVFDSSAVEQFDGPSVERPGVRRHPVTAQLFESPGVGRPGMRRTSCPPCGCSMAQLSNCSVLRASNNL